MASRGFALTGDYAAACGCMPGMQERVMLYRGYQSDRSYESPVAAIEPSVSAMASTYDSGVYPSLCSQISWYEG